MKNKVNNYCISFAVLMIIFILFSYGCSNAPKEIVEKQTNNPEPMQKPIEQKEITLRETEKEDIGGNIILRFLGEMDKGYLFEINKVPIVFELGKGKVINRAATITLLNTTKQPIKETLIEFAFITKDGHTQDTLFLGKTKRIFVNKREYIITPINKENGIAFIVNGEETDSTEKTHKLRNGNIISLRDVIETDKETQILIGTISIIPVTSS